jgi:hypothetical protein
MRRARLHFCRQHSSQKGKAGHEEHEGNTKHTKGKAYIVKTQDLALKTTRYSAKQIDDALICYMRKRNAKYPKHAFPDRSRTNKRASLETFLHYYRATILFSRMRIYALQQYQVAKQSSWGRSFSTGGLCRGSSVTGSSESSVILFEPQLAVPFA